MEIDSIPTRTAKLHDSTTPKKVNTKLNVFDCTKEDWNKKAHA
jgi:hypothetical protein